MSSVGNKVRGTLESFIDAHPEVLQLTEELTKEQAERSEELCVGTNEKLLDQLAEELAKVLGC